MFTPSPPATSMSPAPAAAGAGAMHWLSTASSKILLMFVMQIFKAHENKHEDIFEIEDFQASRIDGVKRNKREEILLRGLRRALILGFNSYPPKAYEITLPLIVVEWQQFIRKRPLAVNWATNCNNDSGRRWKESGALTGPLFAFVNCMFNGGCGVVEDVEQHSIGIYSPRTRYTFTLPPIPGLRTGIPRECRCVSLNGRLYVLGGLIPVDLDFHVSSELCFMVSSRVKFIASSEVYVMDLRGGKWQWETLPNMHDARRRFGVGVWDEKIFVFGGEVEPNLWSARCEVFDPEVNTWYRIRSMPSPGICHKVATCGEKLFLHAGVFLTPQLLEHRGVILTPQSRRVSVVHDLLEVEFPRYTEVPDPLEDEDEDEHEDADVYIPLQDEDEDAHVYDPLQDEWSLAGKWLESGMDAVFVSDGRLLAMAENGIYQSRVDRWEKFTKFAQTMNISRISSYATEALDGIHGGLVTLAHWKDDEHRCGHGILQSSEFREHLEPHWEIITFNTCPTNRCAAAGFNPFFCRIVL